jgi:hypothetical protein
MIGQACLPQEVGCVGPISYERRSAESLDSEKGHDRAWTP